MYISAPSPSNEALRLSVLRALDVLDSAPEKMFDSLASSAALLCEAPIALVSLVDEKRQWFKAAVGLDGVCEMPREIAFCAHVVAAGELMEIPDTALDIRFAGNPLVTGPENIQFYAGAPIRVADGLTIGSLCVIDHVPRRLEAHQLRALTQLAHVAARGLEARADALRAMQSVQRSMRELSLEREFLEVTLSSIVDAVITADPAGHILWMNPAAERITGWISDEALGRELSAVFVVFDEESRASAPSPIARCLVDASSTPAVQQLLLVARTGREFGIECAASAIRESNGEVLGAVLTFHDVSEQRRLNSELSRRAMQDALTGLPNRAAFEAAVGDALAAAGDTDVHVLMYIDLDQFKVVNDACGHAAGDQLLRQIGGIVRACVRGNDTVARLGGDEFGLLLLRCGVGTAEEIAQKICDRMDDFRFVYDGRRFRVGASIGLVPLDRRWPDVASALQAADASCYGAKEEGRNRVHTWRESDTALETRRGEMQWISRLELALDEDRFQLHGQRIAPIVAGGPGLHFEVLLRMRDGDDDTLCLPGAFLPIAERFHLATRIDRWVVDRAFAWMTRAAQSGVDVDMMSINLSGQTVGDAAFHRDLVDRLGGAEFDVSRLCFEITETAAITHLAEARTLIEDVRGFGVKVALDDFGAGASSFGYLKSLPVDFLKIDGHFITNLLNDPIDNAAVRCFCEMARVMGVRTIAEFVENDAVREELHVIGVDMAQGYLIHRPEPLDRLLFAGASPDSSFVATPIANPMIRDRALTEIAVHVARPNCLDLSDATEVLLWADDLLVTVERLREVAAKVGPMRAAIRWYIAAQKKGGRALR